MRHDALMAFIKGLYPDQQPVALHRPVFSHQERAHLEACLLAGEVSAVGEHVPRFEQAMADRVGCQFAMATLTGTNALQVALQVVGVGRDCEVLTQALTFVATCNAASYLGAQPVFIDVDSETLGMSAQALERFLMTHAQRRAGGCFNRHSGRRIAACLPVHTLGHPCHIDAIVDLCAEWAIPVVEDAAEALGSRRRGQHVGSFGRIGVFSFNGNKVITTGAGGMIVTDDAELARRARHLITTAKVSHPYEYLHDDLGYNFRMPNLNAALGCAQLAQLDQFLTAKRDLAERYADFFAAQTDGAGRCRLITEPAGATSNHWLNAICLSSLDERNALLDESVAQGVMMRPLWTLMTDLPTYAGCQHDGLECSRWLLERVVCLPSSVP